MFRFRDYFVDSYLPIEEAKANKLYEETKDVIANFIGRLKEARNFYDFLSKEENKEKYLRLIMRGNYLYLINQTIKRKILSYVKIQKKIKNAN